MIQEKVFIKYKKKKKIQKNKIYTNFNIFFEKEYSTYIYKLYRFDVSLICQK